MANTTGRAALIVWGGWDGHEPQQVAEIYHRELSRHGFRVDVSDTLDAYKDNDLTQYSPHRPRLDDGEDHGRAAQPVLEAVKGGVGLRAATAGCATRSATRPSTSS